MCERSKRSWAPLLVALFALATALLTTLLRALKVQDSLGSAVGCEGCFIAPVVASDLWLVSLIAALAAVLLFVRARTMRAVVGVLMFAVVAVMAADVLTYSSLSVRLYVSDIGKFGGEISAIHRFLMVYFDGRWPFLLAGRSVE